MLFAISNCLSLYLKWSSSFLQLIDRLCQRNQGWPNIIPCSGRSAISKVISSLYALSPNERTILHAWAECCQLFGEHISQCVALLYVCMCNFSTKCLAIKLFIEPQSINTSIRTSFTIPQTQFRENDLVVKIFVRDTGTGSVIIACMLVTFISEVLSLFFSFSLTSKQSDMRCPVF